MKRLTDKQLREMVVVKLKEINVKAKRMNTLTEQIGVRIFFHNEYDFDNSKLALSDQFDINSYLVRHGKFNSHIEVYGVI